MKADALDVLIVGAGAAGLAAALEARRLGLSCRLIEARLRIGGRVHSSRDPAFPCPIELGAEFVHGRPRETQDWTRRFALDVYDVPDRHCWVTSWRVRRLDDFWDRLSPALVGEPLVDEDESFSTHLRRLWMSRRNKSLARAFVQGFHAADPDELSQRALAQETQALADENNQAGRIYGGYGALIDELGSLTERSGCPILLGAPVTRVHWERGGVEIHTAMGHFHAKAMILTLPPPLISRLAFEPGLPGEKTEAMEFLPSGAVLKPVFHFRERFWEKRLGADLSFAHSTRTRIPTWWTQSPFRWNVLTGWVGGPAALELSSESDDMIREIALVSLSRLCWINYERLRGLVTAFRLHNWQTDPYAQGAYSYLRTGGRDAPRIHARPLEGTLFFAGEATETSGVGGTVEGALHSGRRAARQVSEALRRAGRHAA
jgi:monoamine oxidase